MASLSLRHIYKKYPGNVVAVKDVNLEIKDKEFIVLVGPSGCGKSTTLRMIAGLEEISEGELYIGDRLVNDIAPKDRDIAMVFQNYALYPHMTVFDNMAFGLKLRKVPKDEIARKVEEAAKILDLSHLLDRKPKAMSGGQRQRVALGRAIVRNPQVFLLDERAEFPCRPAAACFSRHRHEFSARPPPASQSRPVPAPPVHRRESLPAGRCPRRMRRLKYSKFMISLML